MPLLITILGLVIGSFIGALTYRHPRGISLVKKSRSFCDSCGWAIFWYDNIPLVSYLTLFGRCRKCGKRISPRYPIIEATTALAFLLIGPSPVYLLLFCLFEIIFIIDLEHQIIPDLFVFFGFLVAAFIPHTELFSDIFSGFAASLVLFLIYLVTKGKGMGLGDVKLAIFLGFLVGLKLNLIWLFLSFLIGGVFSFILLLLGTAKLKDKIAFGPFMIIAAPLAILFGEKIIYAFFY